MQDLSNDAATGKRAFLVPSSMSSGGEVHFDPENIQMTAPGSQPVSAPAPEWPGQAPETLPLPVDAQGDSAHHERTTIMSPNGSKGGASQAPPQSMGKYKDAHDVPAASRWTETS
jgi:hypothetical protein